MNPLTNVKNITKLNEFELNRGVTNKGSWHTLYKDSAWIFIGGLAYGITEGDVITVFSQYGEIVNINMIRDKKTGKTKGYCFLCYANQKSTVLAVDNLNGIKICNRIIRVDHVQDYKPPKEHEDTDEITKKLYAEGCAPKPFKKELLSEDDDIVEVPIAKLKKPKKEKKKKKKKHKKRAKSETDSSSSDDEKKSSHNSSKKKTRSSSTSDSDEDVPKPKKRKQDLTAKDHFDNHLRSDKKRQHLSDSDDNSDKRQKNHIRESQSQTHAKNSNNRSNTDQRNEKNKSIHEQYNYDENRLNYSRYKYEDNRKSKYDQRSYDENRSSKHNYDESQKYKHDYNRSDSDHNRKNDRDYDHNRKNDRDYNKKHDRNNSKSKR